MKNRSQIRYITGAAIIAAVYVVLTYITSILGLANGVIQCRLSEAMCILPVFIPAAVPGLFIGCIISNLLTGCIIVDIVFGSLATLLGAYGTLLLVKYKVKSCLYPLPTILSNAVILPFVLKYAYGFEGSILYFVVTVLLGEIISCGFLGMVLYYYLNKFAKFIFK